jgi:hypothetical protein
MSGWIYVLTNRAFPGLVKIGMTRRTPQERAKELQTTGVPYEYNVAFQIEVGNPSAIEKKVFRKLSDKRERDNREFFKITVVEAKKTIQMVLQENQAKFSSKRKVAYIKKASNNRFEIWEGSKGASKANLNNTGKWFTSKENALAFVGRKLSYSEAKNFPN